MMDYVVMFGMLYGDSYLGVVIFVMFGMFDMFVMLVMDYVVKGVVMFGMLMGVM